MSSSYVNLARGFLRDEKIHFIIKRYGHDTIVVWTGLLTEVRNGILEMPEEVFAEVCLLDFKRYEEIINSFIRLDLVTRCNDGKLKVCHWEKYQYSESYSRVKAHRARRVTIGNENETACNKGVVTEKTERNNINNIYISQDDINNNTSEKRAVTECNATSEKRARYNFSPEDKTLADEIFGLILAIHPNHRRPNLDAWASDVRLMRERDHHSHADIRALFRWANDHHFWRANILSPATLRRQWDRLSIQMHGDIHGTRKKSDTSASGRVEHAIRAKRQQRERVIEPVDGG